MTLSTGSIIQKSISSLLFNQCLTTIEHFGGRPVLDDRGLDLNEAIERVVRDAFEGWP